ncbi:3-deoxy-manno-octulosonate cytidylyltransferase [Chromatiales bacterium (ex Bugula neritina AB1)]|nr:3-deoxy-manno-octulosonate cytidylyltransferase [Chromatiales bacterium (ex Bugula neritina AB1)]
MPQQVDFSIVIPARYNSSRFPGKPLAEIDGVPMVMLVHQRALESQAREVIIATDDERIADVCRRAGARVCMTSPDHLTGTDRIAEVSRQVGWAEQQVVVNVQGDEPLIPVSAIRQVAANLHSCSQASVATLCTPITDAQELRDPNVVKVVFDKAGLALYFSRSLIPHDRDSISVQTPAFRHLGLYAYRVGFLSRYAEMAECEIEQLEKLEQLRALWHGERIHVSEAVELPGMGVDTPADLDQVANIIKQMKQ